MKKAELTKEEMIEHLKEILGLFDLHIAERKNAFEYAGVPSPDNDARRAVAEALIAWQRARAYILDAFPFLAQKDHIVS